MRKNFFSFLILFSFLFTTNVAMAHFLGYSSVDEGEIRWGGSSIYATHWNNAVGKWNALDPINILPDTVSTYEDLRVSDVNLPNAFYYGVYAYYSVGTDTLKLNTAKLSTQTSSQKQNTITHELGHSLGLAHSIENNVMYFTQTSQTILGPHDIEDYNNLY